MPSLNMIQALNSALDTAMTADPKRPLLRPGHGLFRRRLPRHDQLQQKHGLHPLLRRPIAEGGIVASAIGMAVYGLRPCIEIQFADYIYPGYDQLVSEAAKIRYRSGGEFTVPITVRTPYGGGIFGGQTHSQSPEACSPTSPG
jgi:2-oxoisovalerate dehydrogenase E1 component beta subunit